MKLYSNQLFYRRGEAKCSVCALSLQGKQKHPIPAKYCGRACRSRASNQRRQALRYWRGRSLERKLRGVCHHCDNARIPGIIFCQSCRIRNSEWKKKRRRSLKERNYCRLCRCEITGRRSYAKYCIVCAQIAPNIQRKIRRRINQAARTVPMWRRESFQDLKYCRKCQRDLTEGVKQNE